MKFSNNFDEIKFRQSVEKALRKVETILFAGNGNQEVSVVLPHDAPITYNDQYDLAEFVTNTSILAQLQILQTLGLTPDKLRTILGWLQEQPELEVTLQFQASDGCSFLKETEVEVPTTQLASSSESTTGNTTSNDSPNTPSSPPTTMTTTSFFGLSTSSMSTTTTTTTASSSTRAAATSGATTKVKEYHWKVFVSHSLRILKNSDVSTAIELQSRNASTVLITTSAGGPSTPNVRRGGGPSTNNTTSAGKPTPPIVEKTVHPTAKVSLTWLFQNLKQRATSASSGQEDESGTVQLQSNFSVDRTSESCRTPRRNWNIQAAYEYHQNVVHLLFVVLKFCLDRLEKQILAQHKPHITPSAAAAAAASNTMNVIILTPGTKCQMVNLEKEPAFNEKYVVVKEYLHSLDRYRVEPVNAADQLPASLTIHKKYLRLVGAAADSSSSTPQLSSVTVEELFVPVVPFFLLQRKQQQQQDTTTKPNIISLLPEHLLLQVQKESMIRAMETKIVPFFAPRQLAKLASQAEAQLLMLCTHWLDVIERYQTAVHYLEELLRQKFEVFIPPPPTTTMAATTNNKRTNNNNNMPETTTTTTIQSREFQEFVRRHLGQLYVPRYAPQPFQRILRRDEHHDMEGMVSIDRGPRSEISSARGRRNNNSIHTFVRQFPVRTGGGATTADKRGCSFIGIPINDVTTIQFVGDSYLHGWMQLQFEGEDEDTTTTATTTNNDNNNPPSSVHRLVAKARQFSQFVLVVGALTCEPQQGGAEEEEGSGCEQLVFEPSSAIVLESKDEVLIPILTQPIIHNHASSGPATSATTLMETTSGPSAAALASLSPQQQAFCRAFHQQQQQQQLSSSHPMFGIGIIPIQPHLERLLGLANGALAKEIQLTQDLLSLFADYHVPSDLVSCCYEEDAAAEGSGGGADKKLAAVKEHVQRVKNVIEIEKQKQSEQEQLSQKTQEAISDKDGGEESLKEVDDFDDTSGDATITAATATATTTTAPSDVSMVAHASIASSRTRKTSNSQAVIGGSAPTKTIRESSNTKEASSASSTRRTKTTVVTEKPRHLSAAQLFCPPFPTKPRLSSSSLLPPPQQHEEDVVTLTAAAKEFDSKITHCLDRDPSLRRTMLSVGSTWTRSRPALPSVKAAMLASSSSGKSTILDGDAIASETFRALNLLNAMTRSGTLPIVANAELHMFLAVSHCFENDVLGTILQDNTNPIDNVEQSSLLLASSIYHHQPPPAPQGIRKSSSHNLIHEEKGGGGEASNTSTASPEYASFCKTLLSNTANDPEYVERILASHLSLFLNAGEEV